MNFNFRQNTNVFELHRENHNFKDSGNNINMIVACVVSSSGHTRSTSLAIPFTSQLGLCVVRSEIPNADFALVGTTTYKASLQWSF